MTKILLPTRNCDRPDFQPAWQTADHLEPTQALSPRTGTQNPPQPTPILWPLTLAAEFNTRAA